MAKAGITVKLDGFQDILQQIKDAGGDIDRAAKKAITESAKIVEDELKAQTLIAGVPQDIRNEIRTHIEIANDNYSAEVGWTKGAYNPKKPSAAYKAIFLNYGTVRRKTRKRENRGQVPASGSRPTKDKQFLTLAKKKSRSRVKKAQEQILKEALGELIK